MTPHNLLWISALVVCVDCTTARADEASAEFMIGADISWVQQQKAEGRSWSDAGINKDILAIFKDHGFNWIRLRIFVNPEAEGGYSKEGFCDLDHTLQMAKRVQAAGMRLLLDFHYSDTWADPAHQRKPAAWANLHGDDLEQAVHDHTEEVLIALRNQGTCPDIVQIGNEISHGMLWPDGKVWETKDWDAFCGLIEAGGTAVREVAPSAKIMIHLACGGQNAKSRGFLDRAIQRDVDFDLIGQSYYPKWHGTLDDLKANLTDLARRYGRPIVVVEYSVPNVREINDIVRELPNDKGLGTFIWEPTKWQGVKFFNEHGSTRPAIDGYAEMAMEFNSPTP